MKPGRRLCFKCFKISSLCKKYPEIKAFYIEDERVTQQNLQPKLKTQEIKVMLRVRMQRMPI